MIISKAQLLNVLKVYNKGDSKVEKAQAAKAAVRADELAISRESKVKQKAMQAARQAEDIRLDKVTELQEQISAGSYTLSDDEVAEKMIERVLVDRLI
ncbi:MAG: flagellar biosynthesis anti-sigma factor FlgM [Syntrophomonas sp.]|uniref:flagellar biosynthesis anti-sigma factor FlgM n=1 Tax=Syntrophomonas sp. TaxID=2053627 RepID=UPI0026364697|nr:flagellar biosynthesis anti-sigma factor FlgM [Syntrophomonas sp.]MDD2510712.1 flagellar biosynthesis anti-sigma factor FlgM [Syntrophomonas sp.]MDD3879643.1 flagellar biosynthesis anti-sigma factor FlgM [Syntrophomonas sp.]MDD4626543.1 flagellar biosynthesis anti-sigma factor FlgM [Syntrophomonas sp.]